MTIMTRTRMRLTITVFMNTCKPVSPLAAGTPYEWNSWNTRILHHTLIIT